MDIKEKIRAWFNGPQDYLEGLELLQEVSKKAKVMGKLARGESKARREKLVYELNKVAGLAKIPVPGIKKSMVKVLTPVVGSSKYEPRFSLIPKGKDIDEYPEPIKQVIRENSSLYMQRGKLHKQLSLLGEDNDSEVVKKRAEIVVKIKATSEKLDELFEIFKAYDDNGSIPSEKPVINPNNGKESIEELKREKKNLQASLAKDRNILEYQNKTKPQDGKANPIPAGPKRTKLEKRVKGKEAQIRAIDAKIVELE